MTDVQKESSNKVPRKFRNLQQSVKVDNSGLYLKWFCVVCFVIYILFLHFSIKQLSKRLTAIEDTNKQTAMGMAREKIRLDTIFKTATELGNVTNSMKIIEKSLSGIDFEGLQKMGNLFSTMGKPGVEKKQETVDQNVLRQILNKK